MQVNTPLPVHCLNCGGGDSGAAIVGVIIAGIALVVSFVALGIAIRQHRLSAREHREFLKQLHSRARFELTARLINTHDDRLVDITGVSMAIARLEIGLSNVGDRAAGPTTMNVLIPGGVRDFRWASSSGEPYGPAATTTAETLGDDHRPPQWLAQEIPRVRLRTPELRWVQFQVERGGLADIPIRVKAQSDDLPEDDGEKVLNFTVEVRGAGPR